MAIVDIELNVEESRLITTVSGTGHHWTASYYYCRVHPYRSEPLLDKDTGNSAEYDRHGEVTEDTQQRRIQDIQQRLSGYGSAPKSLAGGKKQVVFGYTKFAPKPPHKPPWIDTGTHTFELTGQKTGDTASPHAVAIQTLEKDLDSFDATIYIDGAATHGNANGSSLMTVTTGPKVILDTTISTLFRPQMVSVLPIRRESCANRPQTGTGGCLPPQGAYHFR